MYVYNGTVDVLELMHGQNASGQNVSQYCKGRQKCWSDKIIKLSYQIIKNSIFYQKDIKLALLCLK